MKKIRLYIVFILFVFIFIVLFIFIMNYNVVNDKDIKSELSLFLTEFVDEKYELDYTKMSPKIKKILFIKKNKYFKYNDEKLSFEFGIDPLEKKISYFRIIKNYLNEPILFPENKIEKKMLRLKIFKERIIGNYTNIKIIKAEDRIILSGEKRVNGYKVYYWGPDEFKIHFNKKNKQFIRINYSPNPIFKKEIKNIISDEEIIKSLKRSKIFKKKYKNKENVKIVFSKDSIYNPIISKEKYFYFFNWSYGFYSTWLHRSILRTEKIKPILVTEVHIQPTECTFTNCKYIINVENGKIVMWY